MFFTSLKLQSVCNLVNALIKILYWKPLLKCFFYIIKFDGFNKIKGDICSGTINAFVIGGQGKVIVLGQSCESPINPLVFLKI
jgi:hypothetical protein